MLQHSVDPWMTLDGANRTSEAQLTLGSQMSELELVPPWIETLSAEYGIPASTQFAMNLCLEEVLSNVIRHGYSNQPGHTILVRYVPLQEGSSNVIVEDEAPLFDPLAAESIPVEETLAGARVGGLGIRLLRGFATSLKYDATPTGNRLTMGFSPAE